MHTVNSSCNQIAAEVRRMGAAHLVISTNLRLRLDGLPYSGQTEPADVGVAVYFQYQGRPTCLACDKWDSLRDNLRAIVLTLEAMRGLDRWGAADLEATFTGYVAIAPPAGSMWFEVLGVVPGSSDETVRKAYYDKMRAAHPDAGGSHEESINIRAAWDAYLETQKVRA